MSDASPSSPEDAQAGSAADARSAYEVALVGPILFALLIVLQGMITLIFLYGPNDKAKPAGLVGEGISLSRPERDIPLYVAGSAVAVIAMLGSVTIWNRLVGSVAEPLRPRLQKSSSLTLALLGIGSFLYYTLMLAWKMLAPRDGSSLIRTPAAKVDIYLLWLPAVLAIICAAWELYDQRRQLRGTAEAPSPPSAAVRSTIHILMALLIIISLYIPHATWPEVAGTYFLPDWMHHWNFFGMGPALKWAHGEAFHRDFYVQYGMGWPALFVALSRWLPLSYANMLGEGIAASAIYHVGLYLLLIQLFRKTSWALIGVILCVGWQVYIEQAALIWETPSSTMMRSPLDVFLFLLLLRHRLTGKQLWIFLTGAAVGLGLFFELDTGIYLLVTVAFYGLVCLIAPPAAYGKGPHLRRHAVALLWLLVGLAAVLLPLYTICSRGSILHLDFWTNSMEAFDSSTVAGISMLPIAELKNDDLLFFVLQITFDLVVIGFALCRIFQRQISPRALVLACIAVYGMGCMLLFVGRSHPFNLYHVVMPFTILLVAGLYEMRQALERWFHIRLSSFAPLLAGALALVLVSSDEFLTYPSALVQLLCGHTTPIGTMIFPDQNDLADIPDNTLRGPTAFYANEIRQVCLKARTLSAGHDQVVFLDFLDTTLYYGSGIDPWSRYPVLFDSILTDKFLKQMEAQLLKEHPRYVFIRAPGMDLGPHQDVWESLYDCVSTHYKESARVGSFVLFEYDGGSTH